MFDFRELEGQGTLGDIEEGVVTVPSKLGAYVVWRVEEDGNPKSITRAFGVDSNGILFFGCAYKRPLNKRIENFHKAAQRGNAPHSEGKRYHNLKYTINKYPLKSIRIGWRTDNNAEACEKNWLDTYEKEFGELPPLNYQSGRKNNSKE